MLSDGNPDAKRLYDDLLSNYNKLVRPVVNVTDSVRVKFKLKLSQLIDVVRLNGKQNGVKAIIAIALVTTGTYFYLELVYTYSLISDPFPPFPPPSSPSSVS